MHINPCTNFGPHPYPTATPSITSAPPVTAHSVPPVHRHIDRLKEMCASLHGTIDSVEARLHPVLTPQPPTACDQSLAQGAAEAPKSSVAFDLDVLGESVARAINRLEYLKSLLEV